MATATRTPQNNKFNSQKQSMCTCVYGSVRFFAITSKKQREMTKFKGFLENVTTQRRIERRFHKVFCSRILRPQCTSRTNWSNLEGSRSFAKLHIQVTFSLQSPLSLLKLPIETRDDSFINPSSDQEPPVCQKSRKVFGLEKPTIKSP